MNLIESLRSIIYPFSSLLVTKASLVEGVLKGHGLPFRCLFVHNSLFNNDIRERMYEGPTRVLRSERVFIPLLRSMLKRRRAEYDLCIAVLPRMYDFLFDAICDYKGQEEVRQVIDVSSSWDEVRKLFSKKKRQVTNNFAEKHGLSYRLSSDSKDFDFFYRRMHVPHIQRRYGHLAQVNPYADMKAQFLGGVLLFVMREGESVAGALASVEGTTLLFRRTGVLDGDEAHVKGGAQTALYYFQIKYAIDNGFHAVDTMKSAPFLNDGVFRHKAEWGARTLIDHEAARSVFFFTNTSESALAHLFEANPLIVHTDAGLRALIGDSKSAVQGTAESGRMLAQQVHAAGLVDAVVHSPSGRFVVAFERDEAVAAPGPLRSAAATQC